MEEIKWGDVQRERASAGSGGRKKIRVSIFFNCCRAVVSAQRGSWTTPKRLCCPLPFNAVSYLGTQSAHAVAPSQAALTPLFQL